MKIKGYRSTLLLKAILGADVEQLSDLYSLFYHCGYISIPDKFLKPLNKRLKQLTDAKLLGVHHELE